MSNDVKNPHFCLCNEFYKFSGSPPITFSFIGAASNDCADYFEEFKNYFTNALGNKIDFYQVKMSDQKSEIIKKIKNSEMVYLGGGNTKKLLEFLKTINFVEIVKNYSKENVILIGNSAGAYALCNKYCRFDSLFANKETISDINILKRSLNYEHAEGLGLIPITLNCHANAFTRKILKNLAGEFKDEDLRILSEADFLRYSYSTQNFY